jgi:hypothetical protein
MTRRRAILLIGGGIATSAIAALTVLRRVHDEQEQRLRAARADYLAGRISIVDGWILSEGEASGRSSQVE